MFNETINFFKLIISILTQEISLFYITYMQKHKIFDAHELLDDFIDGP